MSAAHAPSLKNCRQHFPQVWYNRRAFANPCDFAYFVEMGTGKTIVTTKNEIREKTMSGIHVVRPGNASGGLVFSVLFALTSLSPAPVYGQGAIEEILVTARKREENLQDIPLTVSAFTAAALQERGIAALQDVADFTPGFDFAHAFGRQDFRPSIRGQSNILGRANAGLFIDGVIVEEGNASVPLAALQRVEVVKGPQSALYGRSTLAGAVNYVLKKPGDEFQGEAHAEYGERDHVQVAVHASGPVSEALGIAVTANHYRRDGEYDNHYAGNSFGTPAINDEVGGEETSSFTAVLSLDPSDRFSLTAFAMYEDSDDEQYAIALQPASFNNCHQVTRGGPLAQPAPPAGTPEAQANFVASAGYNGSGYYCGRVDVDDVLDANGGDGRTNLETSFYDDMGLERESLRLSLKLDFDLTEAFTLTSVTGTAMWTPGAAPTALSARAATPASPLLASAARLRFRVSASRPAWSPGWASSPLTTAFSTTSRKNSG